MVGTVKKIVILVLIVLVVVSSCLFLLTQSETCNFEGHNCGEMLIDTDKFKSYLVRLDDVYVDSIYLKLKTTPQVLVYTPPSFCFRNVQRI